MLYKERGVFNFRVIGGFRFLKDECYDDQIYVGEYIEVNGQFDEIIQLSCERSLFFRI